MTEPAALSFGDIASVLDGLIDGVQIVDRDYRYVHLNQVAVRHARREQSELLGRTMAECYPGIEGTPVFAMIREVMETRSPRTIDNVFTYPDGTSSTFQLRIEPIERGVCIVSIDVGARQHTRILESAPDAMLLVDRSGKAVYVNEQAARMLGYSREELIGQSVDTLVPDRARAAHASHRASFAESPRRRGMGVGMELAARRKDGVEVPVEVGLSPLDELVVVALRDISERKAAEARERRTHERLVSALESFQDAFAIFDADDRLALCNSAYRQQMPATWSAAAVGESFERLLLAEADRIDLGHEPRHEYLERRRRYHASPSGAIEVRTLDERSLRIVERITPEGGRVCTMYDLTDDVKREGELRAAQESAEIANAAKTDFLRSMSHELRTPMNAVLGFAQLLQRDKTLGERPQRLVQHVLSGGAHLLRLIDDVLDLARVEAGAVPLSLEPVEVRGVLEELHATLIPMAERRGAAIVVSTAVDARVRADRTRLSQIVLNFASNAIKYGRDGGRVSLDVEVHENMVRVGVTDDGPGIPLERQDRLFQVFYRAGQETGPIEGTGIGLALTQKLATMMGGTVGFRSEEGKGSSFWVELPRDVAEATHARSPVAVRSDAERVAPGTTILYVEDNPANIAFMEELLADVPEARLLVAPTGELGVSLALSHRPTVVVLDINLPGISGFEVLRILRTSDETKHIPVLALSASAMERDVRRAKEAGFAKYLTKPVKVDELLAALEAILR